MDQELVHITTSRDGLGAMTFYVCAYDISQRQCATFSCGTDEAAALRLRSAIREGAEAIKCEVFETGAT